MSASPFLPAELLLQVMYNLSTQDLRHWRNTCHALRAQVDSSPRVLWNIFTLLAPYFGDVDDFRLLQARTGLLISGSLALQFLARSSWAPSDMDLYVADFAALVVIDWLIHDGYTLFFRSESWLEEKPWLSFDELNRRFGLNLVESSDSAYWLRPGQVLFKFRKGELFIDLIVSHEVPLSAILQFHSTAVMNFISATHAFALFPLATFRQRLSLVLRCDGDRWIRETLAKYERRGFNMTYICESSPSFAPGPRWLRDDKSTDPVVQARAPWILQLTPPRTPKDSTFWETRDYDLALHYSAKARNHKRLYAYSGWDLLEHDGIPNIGFGIMELGRTSVSYCMPLSFREQYPDGALGSLEDQIAAFTGIRL